VVLLDGAPAGTIQRAETPTAAAPTEALALHPTAAAVPVNLLKVYVRFSAPMSEGRAARALRIVDDETGRALDGPFLDMDPELWDPGRRRLTALLDPGRIKRGLAPHEQAGYPLVEGRAVRVVVDRAFRDAAGRPLRADLERRYVVGPAVRARVDPTAWELCAPAAGSADALVVRFDRPLDRALLEHALEVRDPEGRPLPGRASIADGERAWRLRPEAPWRAGRHTLTIDARLEDLAGNSLRRVFDRDLRRPSEDPLDVDEVVLDFAPGPPERERSAPPAK
jgi:hypothetical protein